MYSITDLKVGVMIDILGQPYQVLESQHSKLGRGGAIMKTKLKNVKSGEIIDKTFKGNDQIEQAEIEKRKAQFLYNNDGLFYFMERLSFEQFSIKEKNIGSSGLFLKEGQDVEVNYFQSAPLGVEIDVKSSFKVTKTEPGLKGDRVSAGSKPAIIETGAKIMVPLFIKEGDIIIVNTQNSSYVERAK